MNDAREPRAVPMTSRRACLSITVSNALLMVFTGCDSENAVPQDLSPGIVLKQEGADALHEELAAHVTSFPAKVMSQPGEQCSRGNRLVESCSDHHGQLPLPAR
jgi:hypothetical protein